ncbi:MAG: triphosphoribosyl-dephospho-CoA synthase MdcB [Betaproteobacteria bacterium]
MFTDPTLLRSPTLGADKPQADFLALTLARAAVRALYVEVALEPKPGLVSLRDNGSHADMDAATFVRSLFALRHYFVRIAQAGAQGMDLPGLQALGLAAEARMLAATGGVNTHRGAVFGLGLLCAAAGRVLSLGQAPRAVLVRSALRVTWGEALVARAHAARRVAPMSHGQKAAQAHGVRSALDEAALGFPTVFEVALPALQAALAAGLGERAARVQALFASMAVLDDTNLVHRGGIAGLRWMQAQAQAFVAAGGVQQPDWLVQARALHLAAVQRRLSPGGSADVLASACWLAALEPGHAGARQASPAQAQAPATASLWPVPAPAAHR